MNKVWVCSEAVGVFALLSSEDQTSSSLIFTDLGGENSQVRSLRLQRMFGIKVIEL